MQKYKLTHRRIFLSAHEEKKPLKKINFIYLDFIVLIICADKKYLADVVSISFGKQQLRGVRGHMDLNLFSIPSSNVGSLWWETQKTE